MATTPARVIIGSTGASGMTGFGSLIATHNAAIISQVTTTLALTGIVLSSIQIGGTNMLQDANGSTLEMYTAINYVTTT